MFRPEQGTGSRAAGVVGRSSVGHRWPRPPRVRGPRRPGPRPRARVDAPTPTAPLSPRALAPSARQCVLASGGTEMCGAWAGVRAGLVRCIPLHPGVRGTRSGGGVEVAGCRGRSPYACLAGWHRGALLGAVMPASGHFLLNRLYPFYNSFTSVNRRGPKWEVERGQVGWVDR